MRGEVRMNRKLQYGILTVAVSVILSLILSELALRYAGYQTPEYINIPDEEAAMFGPDPILGWAMQPGPHVIGPYLPGGNPIHMTINSNGDRITAPISGLSNGDAERRPQLLLLGGSISQGLEISDDETFA